MVEGWAALLFYVKSPLTLEQNTCTIISIPPETLGPTNPTRHRGPARLHAKPQQASLDLQHSHAPAWPALLPNGRYPNCPPPNGTKWDAYENSGRVGAFSKAGNTRKWEKLGHYGPQWENSCPVNPTPASHSPVAAHPPRPPAPECPSSTLDTAHNPVFTGMESIGPPKVHPAFRQPPPERTGFLSER